MQIIIFEKKSMQIKQLLGSQLVPRYHDCIRDVLAAAVVAADALHSY